MPPGRLCRLLTGASGEEERMVFRVGIIRGSPGSSRPSEPALCVFDKCPHESLIKMNNCASLSSQPLPTIQQRSFVVYARICIAVFQQRCDKRPRMELHLVATKTLSCLQRIFLHWSPPLLDLLSGPRRPQDYAECNSWVKRGIPRKTGQMGKSLARTRHTRPRGMPIQNTKRERWDGEKVHRRNGFAVVPEERQPLLHEIWISRDSPDPSPDTPFREIETQLEQFAVNARRSPGRILGNHSKDQGANLFVI